jgi:hypothetical protein
MSAEQELCEKTAQMRSSTIPKGIMVDRIVHQRVCFATTRPSQ